MLRNDSNPLSRRVTETLPADQPVWVISDLHMGDGTRSDVFFGKDRHLIALLDRVEQENATLVVAGDAIDFHQSWNFIRVLRAHHDLLAKMSALGKKGRLYYIIGNHDYDITVFREVLNFRVCHELHLGTEVLIRHGYEYDPYISEQLEEGQWSTKFHHLFERVADTWVRLPLAEFYTLPNRLVFWLAHKIGLATHLVGEVAKRFGREGVGQELIANLNFWTWSNMGDSMGIFRPAFQEAIQGPWRVVICGHSHLPGVVRRGDRAYANTGSWSFASSQYVVWNGEDVSCHDWLSGRTYHDELYRPMIDGTLYERDFFQWWRENYMGFLRFRPGEERRGRLKGWQSWVQDHQYLAQLRPLPTPPAPKERVHED